MRFFFCLFLITSAIHARSESSRDRFESLNFKQVCGSYFTLNTNETGVWVRCETPITGEILAAYSGEYLKNFVPKNAKTPKSLGLLKQTGQTRMDVVTFELEDRSGELIGYRSEYFFPEIGAMYRFFYDLKGRVVYLQFMNF